MALLLRVVGWAALAIFGLLGPIAAAAALDGTSRAGVWGGLGIGAAYLLAAGASWFVLDRVARRIDEPR
jgi:hypothetical protein